MELKKDIFKKKYQNKNETYEEFLDRVAGGNQEYRQLMKEKKVMPGGRILANRGIIKGNKKGTYSNCYVVTAPEDNLESIHEADYKLARTFSYGGGCGIDISKLAPNGAKINNAAETSSGSISFLNQYERTAERISQKGRRGALIVTLDIDHPDIEEFIDLKNDINRANKCNISVKLSDKFMSALEENHREYFLEFYRPETDQIYTKRVNPKTLFRKLAEAAWKTGEPGVLYWDRIKEWNICSEVSEFKLGGVNPCGEEPLVPGGSCLLVAVNLAEFVKNPFTEKAKFDFLGFRNAVMQSVIYANEVLDEGLSFHPLSEQQNAVYKWRQIGVEIMGLADTFIKMGMVYGKEESLSLSEKIGFIMINAALEQSALLAKKYGVFPGYIDRVLDSHFLLDVADPQILKLVKEHGLRNSQLLTIGPTGSISNLVGVNGGIEPLYALKYTRKTESLYQDDKYYTVEPPIVQEYKEITGEDSLPEYFISAKEIPFIERLYMQKVWQNYIDAGISSTVNLPKNISIDEVEDLFKAGYQLGLKGITIFREGCERNGILSTGDKEKKINFKRGEIEPIPNLSDGNRQVKLDTGCGTIHLNITKNKSGKINQVFIQRGSKGTCVSNQIAVSRLCSLLFRAGVSVNDVIDQLESVPTCAAYYGKKKEGKKVSPGRSCPSAVAYQLKKYQKYLDGKDEEITEKVLVCPECGGQLIPAEGCFSCNCGYSKCS